MDCVLEPKKTASGPRFVTEGHDISMCTDSVNICRVLCRNGSPGSFITSFRTWPKTFGNDSSKNAIHEDKSLPYIMGLFAYIHFRSGEFNIRDDRSA
jgi:hypothetical protein